MPPNFGSLYDPSASFLGARMPRPRRSPWDLPPEVYSAMDTPYRPGGSWGGAAGYVQDFSPPPSQAAYNFGDANPAPEPAILPAPVGTQSPTEQLFEQFMNWQAVQQSNLEETRRIQQEQFNANLEQQRMAGLVNAFGVFGRQQAPSAGGLAGQQMAARSAIEQERNQAQAQRTAIQQAIGAQEAAAQAGPQVLTPDLNPIRGAGLPDRYQMRHSLGPQEARMIGPYNPRPEWISGPSSAMSVDQGARNTMRGNQAFGLNPSRDNVRGQGANPQEFERFQRMAGDQSPEGDAAFADYERYVLENSPRASQLERGEEAGTMTPAERAYWMARRRRGTAK